MEKKSSAHLAKKDMSFSTYKKPTIYPWILVIT